MNSQGSFKSAPYHICDSYYRSCGCAEDYPVLSSRPYWEKLYIWSRDQLQDGGVGSRDQKQVR